MKLAFGLQLAPATRERLRRSDEVEAEEIHSLVDHRRHFTDATSDATIEERALWEGYMVREVSA